MPTSSPLSPHLLHALRSFSHTSSIRSFLLTLNRTANAYCFTCSPHPSSTPCAPTCPLLRPFRCAPARICPAWLHGITGDQNLYRVLVADIRRYGRTASAERARRWEDSAERLRATGMTGMERHMEDGWTGFDVREAVGMDLEWEFEKGWRVRRMNVDEDFGPEQGGVKRGVKRRREEEDEEFREKKRVKVVHEIEGEDRKEKKGGCVVKRGKKKAQDLYDNSDASLTINPGTKRSRAVDEDVDRGRRFRRT